MKSSTFGLGLNCRKNNFNFSRVNLATTEMETLKLMHGSFDRTFDAAPDFLAQTLMESNNSLNPPALKKQQ